MRWVRLGRQVVGEEFWNSSAGVIGEAETQLGHAPADIFDECLAPGRGLWEITLEDISDVEL